MKRAQKERLVSELSEKLKENANIYLVNFKGLTVSQSNELRRRMKESNSYFVVIKNRLAKKALENGDERLISLFTGPTAIAYNNHDPVILAKILVSFSKENNVLKIKGGLAEKKFVEEKQIREIADLPSREVLMAKLAYLLASPLINVLQLIRTPLMNFGILMNQLKDKK